MGDNDDDDDERRRSLPCPVSDPRPDNTVLQRVRFSLYVLPPSFASLLTLPRSDPLPNSHLHLVYPPAHLAALESRFSRWYLELPGILGTSLRSGSDGPAPACVDAAYTVLACGFTFAFVVFSILFSALRG